MGPAGTESHHAGDSIARVHFRINEGRYAGQCRYQLDPVRAAGVARLASCRRGCGDVPVPVVRHVSLSRELPVVLHMAAATTGGGRQGCCVLMRASSFVTLPLFFPVCLICLRGVDG